MTLREYLSEDGTGPYAHYYVRDLLGEDARKLELLLILESPHTQEILTKIPLSGSSGVNATKFLFGGEPPSQALGLLVASRHQGRDFRVGIMNVSPVPLQELAKDGATGVSLTESERVELSNFRQSKAPFGTIDELRPTDRIRERFDERLHRASLRPSTQVFVAGKAAQRVWAGRRSERQLTAHFVPHPARGWWSRAQVSTDVANLAWLRSAMSELLN